MLKLYLCRHGAYVNDDSNPQHGLSDVGREQVSEIADFLQKRGVTFNQIYHSIKLRAQQTAEIYADVLLSNDCIEAYEGICPCDDIEPIITAIKDMRGDVLLVGHLPFMDKLLAKLVACDENRQLTVFTPGSVVCLEQINLGNWCIKWIITPEIVTRVT